MRSFVLVSLAGLIVAGSACSRARDAALSDALRRSAGQAAAQEQAQAPADAPALAVNLVALPERAGASAALEALRRRPEVAESEPVFSGGERRALRELGEAAMAESVKFTVTSRAAAASLQAWVRSSGLPLRIEENPLAHGTEDSLEGLQWGMRNRGLPQKLDIDDLTTIQIPGKTGEDIGLTDAPAEPANPEHKVLVAVLDTGVDYTHPDLQGQLFRKAGECAALDRYKSCLAQANSAGATAGTGAAAGTGVTGGTGPAVTTDSCDHQFESVDSDGDGYPLDCSGWNVTAGRNRVTGIYGGPDASDDVGHGTHVAGVIAAAINGIGVRGVAQNAQILPVKVIRSAPNQPIVPQDTGSAGSSGGGLPPIPAPTESTLHWPAGFGDIIARGMLYAIRQNAQVISMSLAWPAGVDSTLMRRMVALAEARGTLVVAAAGNDSADSRVYPCLYPGVVCVAAHGPDGSLSHFSNYGAFVDVAAPGLAILSTWPMSRPAGNFTAQQGYEIKNGTSMATPFVAGALARLLEAGYSPQESYARLLTGARPHQPAAYPGAPKDYKYTRSGNADLAGAFRAAPQPLILEAAKDTVKARWDLHAASVPVSVQLKNFWAAATGVRIRAALRASDAVTEAGYLHLQDTEFDFAQWDAGATRAISTSLAIDDPRIEGRMILELSVETDQSRTLGQAPRLVRVPLDLSVSLEAVESAPGTQALPVTGASSLSPNASLRTVTALDGKPGQDYLAIDDSSPTWTLQLLTEKADDASRSSSHYEVSASAQVAGVQGDLMLIERIDADGCGNGDYVFIYRLPPAQGQTMPHFRFQFYDRTLAPLKALSTDDSGGFEYDNKVSVIPERFQWMRITYKQKEILAPAWIALGTTPPLEAPAPDPWNPNPDDPAKPRLYYVAPDGLHSVTTADGDPYFVQLLAASDSLRAQGMLSVLMAKGDDYELSYRLATVDHARVQAGLQISLDRYRMFAGITAAAEVTPLNPGFTRSGTAFSDQSVRGSQRTTVLLTDAEKPSQVAPNILDFVQNPPGITDSVMLISGVFAGASRQGTYTQTHYELQYTELSGGAPTGQVARVGLDRFSFLPAFIFSRTFFPVAVGDPTTGPQGDRLPGMLIPASLGISDGSEVVVPLYQGTTLVGLSRPARFRIVAGQSCDALGNPLAADANSPTRLVFFCGDKFLRVPLSE